MSINKRVINISKTNIGLGAVENLSYRDLLALIKSGIGQIKSGGTSIDLLNGTGTELKTIGGRSIIGTGDIKIASGGAKPGDLVYESDGILNIVPFADKDKAEGTFRGVIIGMDGAYVSNLKDSFNKALCSAESSGFNPVEIFTDFYSARDSMYNGLDVFTRCKIEYLKFTTGKTGTELTNTFEDYFPAFSNLEAKNGDHLASIVELFKVIKVLTEDYKGIDSNLDNIIDGKSTLSSCTWNRYSDSVLNNTFDFDSKSAPTEVSLTTASNYVIIKYI